MDEFYLQDSRSYVGNDVLWWALEEKGYTTDLRKAQVFSKADAQIAHNNRSTDIPWPKPYIDARTRPAVDMQYIKRDEALAGTGIELVKTKRVKVKLGWLSCVKCGRFLSKADFWSGSCPKCGTDSRP